MKIKDSLYCLMSLMSEFNGGVLGFFLANKEMRMSESHCFSFFLASTRLSGWQLVTKAVTAFAIFL